MTLRELRNEPPEGPISATVEVVELRVEQGFRRRVQRTVARLRDDTGEGEAVWFGRRYIERRLRAGQVVALSGKVEVRGWVPRFQNPEFGDAGDDALHAGRIVPVYRLTAGVTAPTLRQRIRGALDAALPSQPEYLDEDLRRGVGTRLVEARGAIEAMHFPDDYAQLEDAVRRLAFDELLALQIGMVARRRQRGSEQAVPIEVADDYFDEAVSQVESVIAAQVRARLGSRANAADDAAQLEIRLTDDQRAAIGQIRVDLQSPRPMMRLLQGDVGSGKTAVAALALAWTARPATRQRCSRRPICWHDNMRRRWAASSSRPATRSRC